MILFKVSQMVVVLIAFNLATVWGYQFLYRASMRSCTKREMVWLLPAGWPVLIVAWWMLGFYDNGLGVLSDLKHYWAWWMPFGALIVFAAGYWFAQWNRSRLLAKMTRSA